MTARKKANAPQVTPHTTEMMKGIQVTAEQTPVTVAELLLALASWPQDARVELTDYASLLVHVQDIDGDPDVRSLWEPDVASSIIPERPQHYQRPDIVERVIRRSEPMDDYAAAREFLEWLAEQSYTMPQQSTGGGHNEPTTYRDLKPGELAEEFAQREQS